MSTHPSAGNHCLNLTGLFSFPALPFLGWPGAERAALVPEGRGRRQGQGEQRACASAGGVPRFSIHRPGLSSIPLVLSKPRRKHHQHLPSQTRGWLLTPLCKTAERGCGQGKDVMWERTYGFNLRSS